MRAGLVMDRLRLLGLLEEDLLRTVLLPMFAPVGRFCALIDLPDVPLDLLLSVFEAVLSERLERPLDVRIFERLLSPLGF